MRKVRESSSLHHRAKIRSDQNVILYFLMLDNSGSFHYSLCAKALRIVQHIDLREVSRRSTIVVGKYFSVQ
jgi:hypothetical protein